MELINGLVISYLLEGAKRLESFPLSPEDVSKIRKIGFTLSVIATLITAYSNGQLSVLLASADYQHMLYAVASVLFSSLTTWLLSVLSYYGLIKKKETTPA